MTSTMPRTEPDRGTAAEPTGTPPEDRGRLQVDRSVLRKIAEYAADQAPDSARTSRQVAGVGMGSQGASARITGPDHRLHVRLDVALRYPTPIREAVRAVRERVGAELARIADCQVHAVDVTVSTLVPDAEAPRVR